MMRPEALVCCVQVLRSISHEDAGFQGKAKITVGVVGYPNVGKSSVINSLLRTKGAETVRACVRA